jgi:hydroxymethylpyrimidine/phosphomethylpyrimidine kinase
MKNLLTIAGSDCSGGAGIQADLKTFSAHGTYGMSVITAVTAQNTQGVLAVQDITAGIIAQQLEAIFEDIEVDAVKIGMVSVEETINVIAAKLQQYQVKNIVVDPVMVSKSGYRLLQPEAQARLVSELLPLATVVTPNIPEAEVITGQTIISFEDMQQAAQTIHAMGPKNVLIKGGHRQSDATDILFDGEDFYYLPSVRIPTTNTHGTGCSLSSAIAANIGQGCEVFDAVRRAKDFITVAIEQAFPLGKGVGPVHHFYALYKKAGLI